MKLKKDHETFYCIISLFTFIIFEAKVADKSNFEKRGE